MLAQSGERQRSGKNAGYVRESAGGGESIFPWRGGGLRRPHFFLRRKKCGKESRLDLRSKDPWRAVGHAKLAVLISRNWYGGYRCRFGGLLVPPAPLPLTAVRVGAGALIVFGDYQIAPIAARSTAMGRWRLTPPGYWGDTACGRGIGSFAPPGASSFLSSLKESYQRKPLETTFQDFLGAG